MNKILVTLICLFFFVAQAYSQSVSAKELANLLSNPDKSEFLKSRSFTVLGSALSENGISQHFLKNTGTSRAETIVITSTLVSYLTHNKAFITNLLTQLKRDFKQTVKDDNPESTYYLFSAGDSKNISINISKTGVNDYSLEVIKE